MTNDTDTTEHRFAVCIRNDGYPASLEVRKLYKVLHDPDAGRQHCLRIIDESGEDYLYPEDYFFLLELPRPLRDKLLLTA